MITTIIAVDLGAVFGLIEVKPLGKNSNESFQPLLANPGKLIRNFQSLGML